eukprot:jgi/Ulvmu1/4828/UM020_0114.1
MAMHQKSITMAKRRTQTETQQLLSDSDVSSRPAQYKLVSPLHAFDLLPPTSPMPVCLPPVDSRQCMQIAHHLTCMYVHAGYDRIVSPLHRGNIDAHVRKPRTALFACGHVVRTPAFERGLARCVPPCMCAPGRTLSNMHHDDLGPVHPDLPVSLNH